MTIPATMHALQLREVGHLDEVELPVPAPKPDEVLIRTVATTICTSDLNDLRENPFNTPLPIVLGHEGAGRVAAVGTEVKDFQRGDRVTAHPVIPCGQCASCREGLAHLCEQMGHLALDRNGTFAEYFAIPAWRVRHVPDGLDLATAALMEPVAVCLEALARARVTAGDTVLIVGDGPFGIIIARLALRHHPRQVILVGRHDFRLAQVPEAVCIHEKRTPDPLGAIRAAAGEHGVQAAILAVGTAAAVDLCLQSLRPRGRLAIFSAVLQPAPVDLVRVHVKELELLGSCNDDNYLDIALAYLADPELHMERLVTHRVPFADWERAFALASHGKDEAIKVALTFPEEGP